MWLLFLGSLRGLAAQTTQLSNGLQMPLVGFGTAGGVGAEAVRWAYQEGVRLFDTAQATEWYDEAAVAEGLQGFPRTSYWLESKLHPRDLGFDTTLAAFPRSLRALNTTYLDVFLIHFPRCSPTVCDTSTGTFLDSWRALEKLYAQGSVKAIGVSNFDVRDLQVLLDSATVVPHVLQNYFDPMHQDHAVRVMCEEHGIAYQGYSTLGTQWVSRGGDNPVLSSPIIAELAAVYDRSPAQIVLSWAVQRGVGVIPRSVHKDNIRQNADIGFEMAEPDMLKLDELDGAQDPEEDPIEVVFVNSQANPVSVLWRGPEDLEPVVENLEPGETFASNSYGGHNFVVQVDGHFKYAFDVSSSYPVYHLDDSEARPHHEL